MFAFLVLTMKVTKDMLSLLAEGQLTIGGFFDLIWVIAPNLFVYALPMGFITACLLTMGRLSAENEVTSFRASGVSVFRLSSSVFVLAILGTAISLMTNFYFGPQANSKYRDELRNTIQTNPLGFIVEKTFVRDFPGTIIYVGEKKADILRDIWIWNVDDKGRVKQFSRAEEGRFQFFEDSNNLELLAKNVAIEIRDEKDPEDFQSKRYFVPTFEEFPFSFSLEKILGKETRQRKLSRMPFVEIREYIATWDGIRKTATGDAKELAEKNYLKARMTFHKTFAMGFAVLSFAFVGVPLGVKTSRKETSANLGVGFGLGLLYYLMVISVDWLDGFPEWHPEWLYWVPNFLYQGVGAWMIFRLDRGGKPKS